MPFQRWWWWYVQRAYPNGALRPDATLRAHQQLAAARGADRRGSGAAGDRWIGVGPAPSLGGQIGRQTGTRPVSGRVSALAIDPADDAHWLIGGAQSGIWESRDSGATWATRTDDQAVLAIGAIEFAAGDTAIVYAGTGEAVGGGQAGAGVLRSTDHGGHWELRGASQLTSSTIRRVRVDPADADHLLAAASRPGLGGRGRDFPPSDRVFLRGIIESADGATTWSVRLPGRATALEVAGDDFRRQYAAIGAFRGDIDGEAGNGVYRSLDGGRTWMPVAGPWDGQAGRIELALAPSNPNVLYVSVQDVIDDQEGMVDRKAVEDGALLWKTQNAWADTPSWTRINTGETDNGSGRYGYCGWNRAFAIPASQCTYDHVISVDPADARTLFAGGIELYRFNGSHWSEVSKTSSDPENGIHADQHVLAWAGTRLVVGNDGGVWSTPDQGRTWATHNTTLALTQFYDGSLHPSDADVALGGTQDNGTQLRESSAWRVVAGGDGAANAFSAADPRRWAVSSQHLHIWRTLDGGRTFKKADEGIDDNLCEEEDERCAAPFIARIEHCRSNDDVLIAGSDNVWRTTNFFRAVSPTWTRNSDELRDAEGDPVLVSALALAPSDGACAVYAAGGADGQLRVTTDGGALWTDLDPAGSVPDRYVTDLAFDPLDSNILYVTLSGFDGGTPGAPGHVFKTAEARAASPTWFDVTPRLNGATRVDLPHNTVAVDPNAPETVYVGTDMALWRTRDAGSTWAFMGPETGIPNVAVYDLQIAPATGRVMAFTYGRGAFVLERGPTPPASPTPTTTPSPRSSPALQPCVGDCARDGQVSVADLVLGVNIALGTQPIDRCRAFDTNGDNQVMVNELAAGVISAAQGCLPVA